MTNFHEGFQDIDSTSENEFFFRFLDVANANASILGYRARMVELCPPIAGAHILDVGCGLGHEVLRLAALVDGGGEVVGIDTSEDFIGEAVRRGSGRNLPFSFQTRDIRSLQFEDDTFDLVRAERVLLYVKEVQQAVCEMARVLRRGGYVAVFDFDYEAFFIDSNCDRLTRRIEKLLSTDPLNPVIGRQIPELLRKAGLSVETIEPFTITPSLEMVERIYSGAIERGIRDGSLTQDEMKDWWADQRSLHTAGQFYHANPGYIVIARKQ